MHTDKKLRHLRKRADGTSVEDHGGDQSAHGQFARADEQDAVDDDASAGELLHKGGEVEGHQR